MVIFNFKDYVLYLENRFGGPKQRTGLRSKAAKFLGCQNAYISQVLKGKVIINLEHAHGLNQFFGHTKQESKYFLLLVEKSRAGTKALKDFFSEQLKEERTKYLTIKGRINVNKSLTEQDQAKFYGSWYNAAIHVMLSVPEFQKKDEIARYLDIPIETVNESLEFLISLGLAKQVDDRYIIGDQHVHLGNDSENIYRHHFNWRTQSLLNLERRNPNDLRYSAVFSLSKKEVKKIKDRMIQTIAENLKDVKPAKEELIYCSTMDFFELRKRGTD